MRCVVLLVCACSTPHPPASPTPARLQCGPIPDVANFRARFHLAERTLAEGCYAQALPALVQIWERSRDDKDLMVVHWQLPHVLGDLVHAFPAARPAIAALRDRIAPSYGHLPADADLADWIRLDNALDESDAVLRWLDTEDPAIVGRDELAATLERDVVPLLIARERWNTRDANRLMRAAPRPARLA